MSNYDSTQDTMAHIKKIQYIFNTVVIPELSRRSTDHDKSKLYSPEKETYDLYIPMLQKVKYGTPEYNEIRDKMAEQGTAHHYEVKRHHPEHFENGIIDMNLFDILEMFFDWYAASLRSDTSFEDGIKINIKKYGISDDLCNIFINTYNDYLKSNNNEFKNI